MARFLKLSAVAIVLILAPRAGQAQTAAPEPLRALCPDRPAKGTSPCTLDAGHFQVEFGAIDTVRQRAAGVTSLQTAIGATTIKYGLNARTDLEISFNPWLRSAQTGQASTKGFGDTILRAKVNLGDQDGPSAWGVALAPFIKLPTARRGLGNGKLEAGLIVPIARALPGNMSLGLSPEVDLIENADGSGRHLNMINVVGLNLPLSDAVTGTLEVWSDTDFDPQATVTQASFDLALAWIPSGQSRLQWDGGLNLGLNRKTPDREVYFGVSRRF